MAVVVLAHAASTLFLAGMIWTIQVVHYPLFASVGVAEFPAYEAAHSARITWVILVPWAVQGLTTAALLLAPPSGVPRTLVWAAAVLAVIPVVVTIVASVPAHEVLGSGFDAQAHARLVSTNWWRTLAWSAHGVVACVLVALHLRGR
ncbi:MAG: hypothetical protein JJT89_03365 [Nitriliruptoraceae bacterium]|nr:hypothetical protein [Nitriliruptoraceae bacterium]